MEDVVEPSDESPVPSDLDTGASQPPKNIAGRRPKSVHKPKSSSRGGLKQVSSRGGPKPVTRGHGAKKSARGPGSKPPTVRGNQQQPPAYMRAKFSTRPTLNQHQHEGARSVRYNPAASGAFGSKKFHSELSKGARVLCRTVLHKSFKSLRNGGQK